MSFTNQNIETQVGTVKYAFFDGDNIGNSIENLLNNGRVKEATHLSESIKLAIFQIESLINSTTGAELIIAGGDDVLIKYDFDKHDYNFLENIASIFTKHTGLSMSCGVGDNVPQAINNLMNAKQQSKGSIKSSSKEETQVVRPKQTKLFIFATSDLPDPYINVIAHCIAYYENLTQVVLINITEDRGKIESKEDDLSRLKELISKQLSSLVSGKYLKKKGSQWEELDIEIQPIHCLRYKNLQRIIPDTKVIVYEDLEKETSILLNDIDSFAYIFDVTAFLKSYLVDVYTILRFKNVSTIYSFELSNERTFDHKELIHNLTYNKTYDYACLAESSYTNNKIVVSETSVISESNYNRLVTTFNLLERSHTQLEDKLATNFAQLVLLAYFLISLPVFAWVCWSIAQPEGWNRMEPLAFKLTFGWFLLTYLLQSLIKGKFLSLDPKELFHVLKEWKKKKLEKSRLNSEGNIL
ncbi:MAG: hypothetical protein HYR56_25575 [Acidobacteria bacterium]|nr:hypothetical protein [Acidobacteriota bacterium]MBI3423295.1 hypothetical protein [Acidobacteriota bacterium]